MKLALLKDRLVSEGLFEKISGLTQFLAASERRNFRHDAYLMPLAAQVGKNSLINATSQEVIETVGVMFFARAINDPTGDTALDAIEAKREAISVALLGWAPDEDHAPMTYAGGELIHSDAGGALWRDDWRTTSYRRAA